MGQLFHGQAMRLLSNRSGNIWKMLAITGISICAWLLITGAANADQTSPDCVTSSNGDKYQCGVTRYWYPGDWSRVIDRLGWNGSLGNGGYNDYWKLDDVDVWDQLCNGCGPHLAANYGGEGGTHNNQFMFPYTLSFEGLYVQVWVDPVAYYCHKFHSNGFWLGTTYYPPVTQYGEWVTHLQGNWSSQSSGCPHRS